MSRRTLKISPEIRRRARRVRLLLMDVDGVLTDGAIHLESLPDGRVAELKVFHAHDGAGVKMARSVGLKTGLITGRDSPATAQRAREMQMDFVYQNQPEKLPAYKEVLRSAGVRDDEVAYVGDDLPDLPILARVGLAVAVSNAVQEAKRAAHYVCAAGGGRGAVREVVELILKAQGKWAEAVRKARA